ncbi:MAG: Fic family protein [Paludibacteraceae bacterium]|nr:Fic family protein [Paludibacteraceae bacterium]
MTFEELKHILSIDENPMIEHKVTIDNLSLPELVKLYHELGIATQIDYDKFYLYSIITHSTAIEGSTVTELENQLLFDEGITSKGRTLNEQMMNLDLKAAYEWGMKQIKTHPDITTAFLCSLASKVMEHTGNEYNTLNGSFSAAKGELRLLNVTAGAGGKSYLNSQKVPTSIEKFCNELNIRRHKVNVTDIQAIYALSFWAHYHLVTIHPWADGNGRTTRLLMNLLQFEFGVLPMKVTKEEKRDYIQALIDSREQDNDAVFIDVMMHMQERHLRQEIMTFCRSMQDGVEIATQVDRKGGQKNDSGGQKTRDAIVSMIRQDIKITTTQMANRLGINRSAVSKHLKALQQANIIRRIGPDNGGHWEVDDKKKNEKLS